MGKLENVFFIGNTIISKKNRPECKTLTGAEKEKAIKEYLAKEKRKNKRSAFIPLAEMRKRVKNESK